MNRSDDRGREGATTPPPPATRIAALLDASFTIGRDGVRKPTRDRPHRRSTDARDEGRRLAASRPGATDGRTDPAGVLLADGGDPRPLDRALDSLRHRHRRRILLLLSEHDPRDVAEFAIDRLATDGEDVERVTTDLYHAHLPKLAAAGYVDWDRERGTIRRGPNFDDIAPLVRLVYDNRDELPYGWP